MVSMGIRSNKKNSTVLIIGSIRKKKSTSMYNRTSVYDKDLRVPT